MCEKWSGAGVGVGTQQSAFVVLVSGRRVARSPTSVPSSPKGSRRRG